MEETIKKGERSDEENKRERRRRAFTFPILKELRGGGIKASILI